MKLSLAALCGLAAVVPSALAGGTIRSGDASFQLVGFPGSFNSNLGDCALYTDTGAIDQGYKYTWYYRTQNNNQNRYMSSIDNPVESFVGDTATITYTNAGPGVANFERFDATITLTIEDGSNPDQVRVRSTCVFKSHADTTRIYNVFNVIDLDLAGGVPNTGPDDNFEFDPFNYVVTQTEGSSSNVAKIYADAPSKWQVGNASTIRSLLSGGAGDLNSSLAPYSGDGAAAFQWTLVLAPGESTTLTTIFTINMGLFAPTCPCVADFDASGGTPDSTDIEAYFSAWLAGNTTADSDCSGGTPDSTDIGVFFNAWLAGGC